MDYVAEFGLFHYIDYKKFLSSLLNKNKTQRGLAKKIAEAANCQPSYLSQSLHTKVQLTQDQAHGISRFLKMDPEEREYFLTLVDYARSGSADHKDYLKQKITLIQEEQNNLNKKLKRPVPKDVESLSQYYSVWLYSYVHILTSIPEYQTLESISKKILLTQDSTFQILSFLEKINLVHREGPLWKHSGNEFHLDTKSSLVTYHHNNWRSEAVKDAQNKNTNHVHYTGVYSISKKDYPQLKDLVVETVKKFSDCASKSGTEEVVIFCCDLFYKN